MKRMTLARTAAATLLMNGTLLAFAAPAPATSAIAPADAPSASLWSRMWRTPDQLGQALLQQGDAAGAAQAFADPQRKGHAALQARDYAGAAKTLSGIDTAEAHYNRGNALAHTGDLQAAINAYEAALKHNPQHTDARHNRDVVAAALQKQKDEEKDSSKQDQQENQDKKGKENDKPGDKPDGKPDSKNDKSDAKPGDGKDGKPNEQATSAPQPGPAPAPVAPASNPKDDAAQAKRDAEAALGKVAPPSTEPQSGASAPAAAKPAATAAAKQPLTEKQIAQEQWLRAIPDDPGGLLRRKFLIEHMLRQQGQKP